LPIGKDPLKFLISPQRFIFRVRFRAWRARFQLRREEISSNMAVRMARWRRGRLGSGSSCGRSEHADRLPLPTAFLCPERTAVMPAASAPGKDGDDVAAGVPVRHRRSSTRRKRPLLIDITELGQRVPSGACAAIWRAGATLAFQGHPPIRPAPPRQFRGRKASSARSGCGLQARSRMRVCSGIQAGQNPLFLACRIQRAAKMRLPVTTLHPNLGVVGVR